ncbi:hypothetical protein [Qipengyuania sediminis]|uniref:hypothetical protein n=1 Tax=Qipengyuania sediminis TaxID=1532023 RepID=UPI00197FF277|nr:hypothetical protein [Qipengyuania sediminis]
MNDTLSTGTAGSSGSNTTGTLHPVGTVTDSESSTSAAGTTSAHRDEAKSRFTAAVNEAKAGVAALKAEATERAGSYREQAGQRSQSLMSDAKSYGAEAKVKGRDLATQGKSKVSEGLTALGQTISDNAYFVDEKLGAKYGDYARTASRSLQDAATRLDAKSIDELGEDARTFVRKSPGTAIGIAAVAGFMLSRLFSGSRR